MVGVIALTVNLGDFAYLRNQNRQNHFAVLIDGRPGILQGTILQHLALTMLFFLYMKAVIWERPVAAHPFWDAYIGYITVYNAL